MLGAVAVLILTACGGSSLPTAVCKGTVSGQVKGTFSVCDDYDNLYLQNMDAFNFSADYTELPTSFVFSTAWTVPGAPKQMTYNQDTMGIECTITVSQGKLTWVGQHGGGSVSSGSCSLNLSLTAGLGAMGNTEAYHLKGTLSGTLDADPTSGATGTVDLSMDFDG
jgi:hypothetical protein